MCKNGADGCNLVAASQSAMRRALRMAEGAAAKGEVPVGAVVFDDDGGIVAEAGNANIRLCDSSAHAEILALRAACQKVGNYRLPNLNMAVTLEPCAMCAGAILHARLQFVVFGAPDDKTGALGGFVNIMPLNHQTRFAGGLMRGESAALLRAFFNNKR